MGGQAKMSQSNSLLAYSDIKEILDRALGSDRGLRVTFPDDSKAVKFQSRANHYRVLLRRENSKNYLPTHELYNACIYDVLELSRCGNEIEIKPIQPTWLEVTEIEESTL